ncbi:MAG: hydroxymethylbilane synthase [Gammaproteobacteria bacterium]|nr:hydroxymethylbilane synthase [Gammaproteobacteria bacterium]
MSGPLRIGTRASALALWQAREVAARLAAQAGAPATELVYIRTSGDLQTEVPLWQTGGRAFFTREIDRALLDGAVDVAVHSLKDLPTELEAGITLGALLPRADPRDALLSRSGAGFAALPAGARIGTSSLRRRAFLARLRPDAALLELRGNVPTRIERLQRGDYDAIVLAAAGVTRLGLAQHVSEYLDSESFPPAVSQGVIAVCARSGDAATRRWLGPLDDADARLSVTAERALLRHLEGGCQVPLGALATVRDGRLSLMAAICALDGKRQLSARAHAPAAAAEAEALGIRVAQELLGRGAADLMQKEREARAVEPP